MTEEEARNLKPGDKIVIDEDYHQDKLIVEQFKNLQDDNEDYIVVRGVNFPYIEIDSLKYSTYQTKYPASGGYYYWRFKLVSRPWSYERDY